MSGRRVGAAMFVIGLLGALVPAPPVQSDGNEAPGAPEDFRALTAGDAHTCALLDDGTVKCWGRNNLGQLGLGDTLTRGDGPNEMGADLPTVNLGANRTATAISAGEFHTCALMTNGTVKCWGSNLNGALGTGDTSNRGDAANEMGGNLANIPLGTGRTATAISAGGSFTCALLDDGTVKCWGNNLFGELGQGDISARGNQANEMGDFLPAINLGAGRTATAITTGDSHACALLDNGTVKCWGANTSGQLGLGDTSNRGDGANEMGGNLPSVSLGPGRTAVAVSAGASHTCALLDNSTVKCWGSNSTGQLGLGDSASRGDGANEMGGNLPAVDLGTGRTATSVAADGLFACAVLDDASVKCWGSGSAGKLGIGSSANMGDGPNEMGDNLPTVDLGTARTAVAATTGDGHACAELDNGIVKCWGNGLNGQLGSGDTLGRGHLASTMGDNLPTVLIAPMGVSGTVSAEPGDPIEGAFVAILNTNDFSLAGGGVTDGNGDYEVTVDPGEYYAYLIESVAHTPGFHGAPTLIQVTAYESTDVDPLMPRRIGSIAGVVEDEASGDPLADAWVLVLSDTGSIVAQATTAANGTYTVAGLEPGTYYLEFLDPSGDRAVEFFDDAPTVLGADPITVFPGATTPADAALG